MLESLVQMSNRPDQRRAAITAELDGGYKLSDLLILPPQAQEEALMVVLGIVLDGGFQRKESLLKRDEVFTLRTVSGEPLGEVKLGMDPSKKWTVREERSRAMLGETPELRRTFPARFTVPAETAITLLRKYGYGMVRPRHSCRSALNRDEKDASGAKVVARDRWLLVEEGSRFEELAQKNGDLKPLAGDGGNGDGANHPKRR